MSQLRCVHCQKDIADGRFVIITKKSLGKRWRKLNTSLRICPKCFEYVSKHKDLPDLENVSPAVAYVKRSGMPMQDDIRVEEDTQTCWRRGVNQ